MSVNRNIGKVSNAIAMGLKAERNANYGPIKNLAYQQKVMDISSYSPIQIDTTLFIIGVHTMGSIYKAAK